MDTRWSRCLAGAGRAFLGGLARGRYDSSLMLSRILVITLNTYREAVRARILMGLFGLSVATAGYAVVVANYASNSASRIISDLGTFAISAYAVVTAVVLGATSLHRELELKTIFPILARPLRREEYLVGKFLGSQLTLGVFMLSNAGILLFCLSFMTAAQPWLWSGVLAGCGTLGIALGVKLARARTWLPLLGAIGLSLLGWFAAGSAVDDRRVIACAVLLAFAEVGIITAVATVFSAFSSPFLTAVMTLGVFVVGRSADTLARLPARVFGEQIHSFGVALSKTFPNLMVYVPPRSLLTGTADVEFSSYLLLAGGQALAWVFGLLALAALMFRRRDFV
jgi:Cu-processing system permease protein